MREYKTKETAIRNIRKGKMLYGKGFRNFQSDKDVCWEAIVHGRTNFATVQTNIPGIEWDSDFVESAFMRMLEVDPRTTCLSELGPYLTPKITGSKEIAMRVADKNWGEYQLYCSPDLFLDEDVKSVCERKVHYNFDRRMFKPSLLRVDAVQHLKDNTDLLEQLVIACPELYWTLPESLRMNRRVSVTICIHTGSFRYVYGNYHDDEEFVLEALLGYPRRLADIFKTCSYRIRKAVGDNDPIEFLKRAILSNELQASLTHKKDDTRFKANRGKI